VTTPNGQEIMGNVKSHVNPGERAPEFTALDDSGRRVSLGDFKGRWVVLFFYFKENVVSYYRALRSASPSLAADHPDPRAAV
jgi:hypothetical protein